MRPDIEPMYDIIGQNIRRLRQQAGLTQDELAQLTGFKMLTSISEIEHGRQRIQVHNLAILADLFGVPMQEFLHGSGE